MAGSAILDVVIGLVFVYLIFSLICMVINEILASLLKLRARDLELGIRNLLKDPFLTNIFYEHPLIESLKVNKRSNPAYIPSRFFALALMDIVTPSYKGQRDAQEFRQILDKLPSDGATGKLKKALLILVDEAGDDCTQARNNIEFWFNNTMAVVSGVYKRRVQWMSLSIALIIALVFNVDTIQIANSIARSFALRAMLTSQYSSPTTQTPPATTSQSVSPVYNESASPRPSPYIDNAANTNVASANSNASQPRIYASPTPFASTDNGPANVPANASQSLEERNRRLYEAPLGIPLGWTGPLPTSPSAILSHLLGWIITAFVIAIGASFWFDTMNRFIRMRSTVTPYEKSPEQSSKEHTDTYSQTEANEKY